MKPYIKLKDQVNKKLAFGDYIISSEQGPVVQKRGFRRIMLPYGALPPIPHKMMTMAVCLLQLSMTIYCYLTQGQQEEGLIAVSPRTVFEIFPNSHLSIHKCVCKGDVDGSETLLPKHCYRNEIEIED